MNWKTVLKILIIAPITFLFSVIILISAYIYLDSIGILQGYDNYLFQKKLKQTINSGVKEIRLKDLTNFEWDEACTYGPYSWHSDDGIWSLIFTKNGIPILESEMRRAYFGELWSEECADNNAILGIFKQDNKYYIKLITNKGK